MSTTSVSSWAVNLGDLGAVYPFMGSEVFLTVVTAILVVGWFVWQFLFENTTHKRALKKLGDPDTLTRVLCNRRLTDTKPGGKGSEDPDLVISEHHLW